MGFELFDEGTTGEGRGVDDFGDGGIDFGAEGADLGGDIEEGNFHSLLRAVSAVFGWEARRILAGFPATVACGGTSRVTTLPAPTVANSPMVIPPRRVTLEPMEAPRLTRVFWQSQSAGVWSEPLGLVARGR